MSKWDVFSMAWIRMCGYAIGAVFVTIAIIVATILFIGGGIWALLCILFSGGKLPKL